MFKTIQFHNYNIKEGRTNKNRSKDDDDDWYILLSKTLSLQSDRKVQARNAANH